MDAKDHPLDFVLKQRQQWVIPVYQRHYAWDVKADKQLPKLWSDLQDRALERLGGNQPNPHFVGAIIYSEPANQPYGSIDKRYLVDGQQRITTFSLVLAALREVAKINESAGLVAAIDEYLFNPLSESMADAERERLKLWSSSYDRPYFVAICEHGHEELRNLFPDSFFKNGKIKAGAPKLLAAYWYMLTEIEGFIKEQATEGVTAEQVLDAILFGFLKSFQIVVVQLGQEDDAQAIFASLNGNAEPLTAFDLIRNDIFHRARKAFEDDEELFHKHWKKLETDFWKEEVKQGRLKRPRTDHLITHTVVAEMGQDINVGQVANEYQKFAENSKFESVEQEVQSLLKYASAYQQMEDRKEATALTGISKFLHIWDMSTFHPLILWIAAKDIDSEKKASFYDYIQSYIVRRDLCGLTNKNYNRSVASLLKVAHAADGDPVDAIIAHMSTLTGDVTRMPSDAELLSAVLSKPAYKMMGSRKLRYILQQIEIDMRNKFDEQVSVDTDNLTIEHIMPQSWAKHWPLPSGESVADEDKFVVFSEGIKLSEQTIQEMDARESVKHCLGNLTMITTSLNPSIGNESWEVKQAKIKSTLLALNRNVAENTIWTEQDIEDRGNQLAVHINVLWPHGNSLTDERTAKAS